jgi:hypothetical protein
VINRCYLIELEDLSWLPIWYRDLMTDVLEGLNYYTKAYSSAALVLEKLISRSSSRTLIDFGSGASGPLIKLLLPELSKKFPNLKLILSDLHPNLDAFKRVSNSGANISYIGTSVDMVNPPTDREGIRVVFTAFHHLNELEALKTLQNAVNAKQPMGIFEVTSRTFLSLVLTPIIPVLILLITPLLKGRRLLRTLFTYIIPIVPLGCFYDGLISNLRTYSKAELQSLVSHLEVTDNYKFEIGSFTIFGPVKGTYLIGYPS